MITDMTSRVYVQKSGKKDSRSMFKDRSKGVEELFRDLQQEQERCKSW